MGLFDFVKNVGKSIFGASEAHAASPEELKKELEKNGLDTAGLEIAVDGNNVSVSGNAATQEHAEKVVLSLGNTLGVSNVNSTIAVSDAGPEAQMYTVRKGDTLWKISEHFYGNGSHYPKILEANTPPVVNENLIQPGWVLRIPAA